MKLVTAEQMRQIDRATIDGQVVPGPELMENAGRGIAEKLLASVMDGSGREKVAIFCGKGNNGGDGFVIGRYLFQAEVDVTIYFIGPVGELSADARLNFDRAAGIGMNLIEVTSDDVLPKEIDCDYLIDA
ncbi:MAG: bifunctional ADP-dependent NAD(P)H-hydrate dehydratase/NAD(P)H-hydrate epimerase, partial [Candidatus Zixiibacteriota bacterium]